MEEHTRCLLVEGCGDRRDLADHSHLSYVDVLPDQTGTQCAAFLDRGVRWFTAQGITGQLVMSDNGSGYVSRVFAEQCQRSALRHLRTRPHTPRTNGKAERFIQMQQPHAPRDRDPRLDAVSTHATAVSIPPLGHSD